ncbi:MAG: hypothetical protein KAK00_04905 [Nanoarchaeota archaeon]|nr:hypothetical protein [Nanoarchaeota archaeon]
MELKIGKTAEALFLIIVFTTFLWISLGNLWDHKLNNSLPVGALASDNFLHLHFTEYLLQSRNMKYASIVAGSGYKDIIWHYAVILTPLAAVFSELTGLESFNSTIFLTFFFSIFGAAIMYFIIKNLNKTVAILSIPLSIFLFSRNFYFIFLWGQYQMIVSSFFVFLAVWCLARLNLKNMYILLAIAISASFHTHQAEAIVLVIFIFFYTLIKLISLRKIYPELIELIKAGILTLVISLYNILLFRTIYIKSGPLIDFSNPHTGYLRTVYLASFGWILIILTIGIIFSLFYLKKKFKPILAYGLFMILWGNLNLIGGTLGSRTIQQRYMWPISLSILFGMGLYLLIKVTKLKLPKILIYSISLIILFTLTSYYYQKMGPGSLVNQDQWNSITWIRDNVPEDSTVLFFYGDPYTQEAILYNTLKHTYVVTRPSYLEKFQQGVFNRTYLIYNKGEYCHKYPYKTGILSFDYRFKNMTLTIDRDICRFDYIHTDTISQNPQITQYNRLVVNKLFENGFTRVYENGYTIILKNNNVNGDCMPETIKILEIQ